MLKFLRSIEKSKYNAYLDDLIDYALVMICQVVKNMGSNNNFVYQKQLSLMIEKILNDY